VEIDQLRALKRRSLSFRAEALAALGATEAPAPRVISLDQSRKQLRGLSIKQDELFSEALRGIEHGLFRSAHVMAWAGFVDLLETKLASDGLKKLMLVRPSWTRWKTIEELRENIPEDQFIDGAREIGLLSKQETKVVKGLLAKRNECAHPSAYRPAVNETLGYVAELLQRIADLQPRVL
jgi:hypothetical protein